jgi:thiaminase/transcriptional activator TenA
MGVFQELRETHHELWERAVTHPFVLELGADTLPLAAFQRYFLQDYVFLRDLVRVVGLAIAGAPDLDSARRLTAFLHDVLEGEESLFRDTFREWGMGPEAYLGIAPAPVTHALGDTMVRAAHDGGYPAAIAALAVTEGTYLDWATRLVEAGAIPRTAAYRAWVEIHSNEGFAEFVGWLHRTLDEMALAGTERQSVEDTFVACLRHEAAFWDAAYGGGNG